MRTEAPDPAELLEQNFQGALFFVREFQGSLNYSIFNSTNPQTELIANLENAPLELLEGIKKEYLVRQVKEFIHWGIFIVGREGRRKQLDLEKLEAITLLRYGLGSERTTKIPMEMKDISAVMPENPKTKRPFDSSTLNRQFNASQVYCRAFALRKTGRGGPMWQQIQQLVKLRPPQGR